MITSQTWTTDLSPDYLTSWTWRYNPLKTRTTPSDTFPISPKRPSLEDPRKKDAKSTSAATANAATAPPFTKRTRNPPHTSPATSEPSEPSPPPCPPPASTARRSGGTLNGQPMRRGNPETATQQARRVKGLLRRAQERRGDGRRRNGKGWEWKRKRQWRSTPTMKKKRVPWTKGTRTRWDCSGC